MILFLGFLKKKSFNICQMLINCVVSNDTKADDQLLYEQVLIESTPSASSYRHIMKLNQYNMNVKGVVSHVAEKCNKMESFVLVVRNNNSVAQ